MKTYEEIKKNVAYSKSSGIEWAPILSVPFHRRMETFSAFTYIFIVLFAELICVAIFLGIFYYGGVIGKTASIIYMIYFYHDRKADENCSRGQGNEHLRSWFIWRNFTRYFPLVLVKTADLSPKKNYIFAVFPHGVIGCSVFGHFATSTTNFRELFPKIRSKLCTLNFHFFVPIFREMVLGWGMMSAKQSSIRIALTQSNETAAECNNDGYTSNAVVIAVGGAQEALNARPGVYKLVLKNRKGFVRIAIETGASIVPAFSFNEVEIFDQPSNEPGTALRKFQDTFKRLTGVAPAFFIGRGFLQYSFGLIPRRHQITTVVGAPIETNQCHTATDAEINKVHAQFVEALVKLFEDHKHKYLKNADKIEIEIN